MNESPFSPEEQKEFEKIVNEEIYKLEAERKKEIDELGHPEWLVTAFQRFRRLQDSLSRGGTQKTNAEIANEIENILELYPEALFAYDQKCLAELDQAYQQLLNAALKKSVDEETGDY